MFASLEENIVVDTLAPPVGYTSGGGKCSRVEVLYLMYPDRCKKLR